MSPNDQELRRIARDWWALHRRGGVLSQAELGNEYDELAEVDDMVDEIGTTSEGLARLLETLVEIAPSPDELPYIGTWVLEDAEPHVGDIMIAVSMARIRPDERARVLSGFLSARQQG